MRLQPAPGVTFGGQEVHHSGQLGLVGCIGHIALQVLVIHLYFLGQGREALLGPLHTGYGQNEYAVQELCLILAGLEPNVVLSVLLGAELLPNVNLVLLVVNLDKLDMEGHTITLLMSFRF